MGNSCGNSLELPVRFSTVPFGSVRFRSVPFGSVAFYSTSTVPRSLVFKGCPKGLPWAAIGRLMRVHGWPAGGPWAVMGGPWWNWNSFGIRWVVWNWSANPMNYLGICLEFTGNCWALSGEQVGNSYDFFGKPSGIHGEFLGN